MTERLYYNDSFLYEFEARVVRVTGETSTVVTLDRSAFYPASGGQLSDTGWLESPSANGAPTRVRVTEVSEGERSGEVAHLLDTNGIVFAPGDTVRGSIDADRRRNHMQQHSGQHVLSAAFEKLYGFATVSFHMGDETCTIDLATQPLQPAQLEAAERLANEIIAEDRPVTVRYASVAEAKELGVRKIPAAERDRLRLIDMDGFDVNACGGTHVHRTGQIGGLLIRRTEKVKQGIRVEFVCGLRAIRIARRDYQALNSTATLLSVHPWELPEQIRKLIEDNKASQKAQQRVLRELAEFQAVQLLAEAPEKDGVKFVTGFFAERDLTFIKTLTQKITASQTAVALLACGGAQSPLVFAQTPGLQGDMSALMKAVVQRLGTRGGGVPDMAQGTAPDEPSAREALRQAAGQLGFVPNTAAAPEALADK